MKLFKKNIKVGDIYQEVIDWQAVAGACFWLVVVVGSLKSCS